MFANKRILVTGSSRGIGLATAKAFLDAGARVAVNGRTAKSTADGIEQLGGSDRLIAAAGDVGSVAGCEAVVASAIDALGGLDVLVNSAGIAIDIELAGVGFKFTAIDMDAAESGNLPRYYAGATNSGNLV